MSKPRLLLFADTMCSWCYGFQPQMETIRAHYADRLDLLTFSGGLRPYTQEPMEAAMRAKISKGYARIAEMSGQTFGARWFEDESFIYDTEPASRAVVTMRQFVPGAEFDYMSAIQRAFYGEGRDITDIAVLSEYAEPFGISAAEFTDFWALEQMQEATRSDFEAAKRLGIDGFPTLIVHRMDGKNPNALMVVSQGFGMADEIIERIDAALAADV